MMMIQERNKGRSRFVWKTGSWRLMSEERMWLWGKRQTQCNHESGRVNLKKSLLFCFVFVCFGRSACFSCCILPAAPSSSLFLCYTSSAQQSSASDCSSKKWVEDHLQKIDLAICAHFCFNAAAAVPALQLLLPFCQHPMTRRFFLPLYACTTTIQTLRQISFSLGQNASLPSHKNKNEQNSQ